MSCRSAAGSLPEGDINQDRERETEVWGGVGWGGKAGGTQRITRDLDGTSCVFRVEGHGCQGRQAPHAVRGMSPKRLFTYGG